ncbi:HRDC domain-containing protein [Paenibacillus paeoniae]|uniref:Aldolase n=1 Tax=Paenibacillus paeoniae TaxID=2292705 RepID=A0A371PIT5_9BACL|nr:HRDC domain-containing protein [Paenibacillus paeoniae]REK75825.1 aldolase [Paenibacillus paeoniae]
MQIVFLNTFEKPVEGGRVDVAQLSICEDGGLWRVLWLEAGAGADEGGKNEPHRWFEGTSWEELLAAFRYGVAKMMGAGYVPIIEGMLESGRASGGSLPSMLQCYGELNADETLFNELREWRRKTAAAEKRSAYLVASNRMLWMISAYVPHNLDELKQLPGWGKSKQEAYGEAVIGLTAGVERATSFPLDWVADNLDEEHYTAWLYKQKENKYKGIMDRQQQKRRILDLLQQSGGLDELQSELKLPRRELLMRIELLEQEGYDVDGLIQRELDTVPEEEQEQIMEAMASIGDRYLKPVLQHVYGETAAAQSGKPVEMLYERLRLIRIHFRKKTQEKAV